jgi:hypothetical protein
MGSSEVLYDVLRRTTSAPPKANHPAGLDPKAAAAAPISDIHARFARECQSILSNMIALSAVSRSPLNGLHSLDWTPGLTPNQTTYLACAIGNDRAARFYEKRGWQRAQQREHARNA